jgi:uncharacterized membrane protein YkoI
MLRTLILCGALLAFPALPISVSADDLSGANVLKTEQGTENIQGRFTQSQVIEAARNGEIVYSSVVINAVRDRYPGMETLDVEVRRNGRQLVYIIKIRVPNRGRVHVIADARTGRIIGEE